MPKRHQRTSKLGQAVWHRRERRSGLVQARFLALAQAHFLGDLPGQGVHRHRQVAAGAHVEAEVAVDAAIVFQRQEAQLALGDVGLDPQAGLEGDAEPRRASCRDSSRELLSSTARRGSRKRRWSGASR